MKPFTLILLFCLLCFSCDEQKEEVTPQDYEVLPPNSPLPKEDRLFGITISDSQIGFEASFSKVQEAGTQIIELNIPWNEIEIGKEQYQDPWNILSSIPFYEQNNIRICFSIAVINTVKWETPEYLSSTPPNSPEFINAFNKMINWFLSNVPNNVIVEGLSIGNEVDLVLDSEEDWNNYTSFFNSARTYIKEQYPNIKIGVKTTIMNGVFGSELPYLKIINQQSDVVMLNYYPQNGNFQVKNPSEVHSDFNQYTNEFNDKEIWLTEVGYQSGSKYCNSSEIKQAQFFHEMFTAWDTHKDQISYLMIDWLHDQSPEKIEEWKNYYGNSNGLVEFLSTLGLTYYDGTEKLSWYQVKTEANARGWESN